MNVVREVAVACVCFGAMLLVRADLPMDAWGFRCKGKVYVLARSLKGRDWRGVLREIERFTEE